jgi:hypothetical protein
MSARYLPWVVLFICVALAWPVQAQSGGDYDLTWSTIDGGAYTLVGGFWGGGVSGATSRYVYLPIVLR